MTNQHSQILIVDDDPDIRDVIKSVLELIGIDCIQAASGKEALEHLSKQFPDLIILDVMMPGLTGVEVCQEFRKMPGSEMVPVMMLTAKSEVQDIVDGLEGGADDYLKKPFHVDELQARVRAHLRVRHLNLSLQQANEELKNIQEKLVQQERQALVGQLAGAAAHELGQPLSSLLLNLHLVQQIEALAPDQKQILHVMKNDLNRMKMVVEQIRSADASKLREYSNGQEILELSTKE